MSASTHPAAPHHLPPFIAAPGETDVLTVVTAVFLILAVLIVGVLFWRLHTLPERIAHRTHKLQLEIVCVLGLISLFTHMHIFWIAGLLLAIVELPDFGTPLARIASAVEKVAGVATREEVADLRGEIAYPTMSNARTPEPLERTAAPEEPSVEVPDHGRTRSGRRQELIDA
jgi:hypothetical protein